MKAPAGPAVTTRWPELIVAAFLFGLGTLVVSDSLRVGIGWADDGPRSGYFPFYIGCLLCASSGWIALQQLWRWSRTSEVFAERGQLALVVSVLLPMLAFLGLIYTLGLYVAAALLIGYFMVRHGRYRLRVTLPVALGVPLFFFVVFERWFLVPLYKGPLERLLGL